MRLFAALVPSVDAVQHLEAAVAPVRPTLPQMDWTSPDDWHVTLSYFGNIGHQDRERLQIAMRNLAGQSSPFDLRIEGVGVHPDPGSVIALWADLQPEADLYKFSGAVTNAVKGFGWVLDRRSFRPQLLLGRSRTPVDATPLIKQLDSYSGPGWTFATLVLLSARPLGGERVELDIVDTYPLSGQP